jgi:hypothetical protein
VASSPKLSSCVFFGSHFARPGTRSEKHGLKPLSRDTVIFGY